jgi:hypothetical protein
MLSTAQSAAPLKLRKLAGDTPTNCPPDPEPDYRQRATHGNGPRFGQESCGSRRPSSGAARHGSSRGAMLPSIWNLTENSAFNLEHGRC